MSCFKDNHVYNKHDWYFGQLRNCVVQKCILYQISTFLSLLLSNFSHFLENWHIRDEFIEIDTFLWTWDIPIEIVTLPLSDNVHFDKNWYIRTKIATFDIKIDSVLSKSTYYIVSLSKLCVFYRTSFNVWGLWPPASVSHHCTCRVVCKRF